MEPFRVGNVVFTPLPGGNVRVDVVVYGPGGAAAVDGSVTLPVSTVVGAALRFQLAEEDRP